MLKGGRDRIADSFMVAVGTLIAGVTMVALFGLPPREAWPYIALTVLIHQVYWFALFNAYDAGDLSHIYTLARGSAPLLVAIGAALTANEVPPPVKLAGILLISVGVIMVGAHAHAPWRATAWALLTGVCIAGYSLTDALGARISGGAEKYLGLAQILVPWPMMAFALWRRGPKRLLADAAVAPWRGVIVGIVSIVGYGLVLWAQTFAPIAPTTALRETSVVFAALIAFFFLRERLGARRWIGAAVVALGAGLIAFA